MNTSVPASVAVASFLLGTRTLAEVERGWRMDAFKGDLTPERVDALIACIRTFEK